MACDARQPVSGSPLVPAQGLELSARPPRQGQVDALQGWVEGRRTEPPIVVDPATNVCIEHTREIIQAFVTPPMHRPTPDSPTDRRERLGAGCRTERDAHAPVPLAHHSWPERVAEKVELKGRMVLAPPLILAIDDFSSFQDAASVRIQQTASQEQSAVLWLGLHHDSDRSHHRHSARTVCPGSSGASTNRTHSAERGWPGGG